MDEPSDEGGQFDPSGSLFSSYTSFNNEELNVSDVDSTYDPSQSLFSSYSQDDEERNHSDEDSEYDPSQSLFSIDYARDYQQGQGYEDLEEEEEAEDISDQYEIELEFERHIKKFNVEGRQFRVIIRPFENLSYTECVIRLYSVFRRKYSFTNLTLIQCFM